MRTVFTNHMCAHVWAQGSQEHGRSGSTHFERDVFFSYSTPVARIVRDTRGNRVALITAASYSVTTSGHVSGASHAFHGNGDTYRVPSLGVNAGRHYGDTSPEPDHARNLAYLMEQYETQKGRLKRMRSEPYSSIYDALGQDTANAEGYADAFGLECDLDRAGDAIAIENARAERAARLDTPAYRAKRERETARRVEREQERQRVARLESAERITQWRAGNTFVRLEYHEMRTAQGSAMLRLRGETVETSQGATVPLAHALIAMKRAAHCHDTGTAWEPNGHTLHVGAFQVNRISANGDVTAGCHLIQWAEIEAFAATINAEV